MAPAVSTFEIPTEAAAATVQESNGSQQSPYLTAERLEQLNQDQDVASTASGGAGFLSNDKLQSIISFLDEVQTADRLTDIDTVRTHLYKLYLLFDLTTVLVRNDEIIYIHSGMIKYCG